MACMLTAAALASPTATVTSIGNGAVDRDTFIKRMRDFGKAHGTGANSRPAAARMAVEAAQTLTDVGPDDAEAMWTEFQKASCKARSLEYKEEGGLQGPGEQFERYNCQG